MNPQNQTGIYVRLILVFAQRANRLQSYETVFFVGCRCVSLMKLREDICRVNLRIQTDVTGYSLCLSILLEILGLGT